MEDLDGGSAKLSYCSEREGVTSNNDLGRRNPWRSGRKEEQCASSQHTINKIFSMEADNINASFPPGGGVLDPSLNNNVQHSGEQEVVTLRELPGRELPDPWFPGF